VNAAAASLLGEGANDLDCTTAGADLHGSHGNAGRLALPPLQRWQTCIAATATLADLHRRHGNAGRLALPPRQRRR
jgi:hypothetical protein